MATNDPALVIDKCSTQCSKRPINVQEPYPCGFLATRPLLVVVTAVVTSEAGAEIMPLDLVGPGGDDGEGQL